MSRLDWPTMMRAGIAGLRLRPDEFWRLTPAEFALLMGLGDRQLPINRAGLAALQARFPDVTRKETRDGSD